jgi:hypothetical protein
VVVRSPDFVAGLLAHAQQRYNDAAHQCVLPFNSSVDTHVKPLRLGF